jgi:glycosyltransferase involved in cell wall biosynthesis
LDRVSPQQARAELGLPSDRRLFGALGFIRAYKGYGLLADVWEQLGAAAPQLLVMGEVMAQSERPVLERLAHSDRVALRLGYATERELRLAVCAADALLLPYTQSSDSGLLHLARALGVPVIASDSQQLAAAVTAAQAGIVLARDASIWATALTGELPPPPPAPVPIGRAGAEHLAVYDQALGHRHRARPMRLVIYTDAVELGGAEQVLTDLLAELDPKIEVTVVGVDASIIDSVISERPSSRTYLLPAVSSKYDISAILAHWRITRRLRADIFQANLRHPWSCQYSLAAALLTPGVKVIAVEHLPTQPTARLQRRLKLLTSKHLDAHIAVGDRTAAELEQLIGLRPGAIEVIHNGVRGDDGCRGGGDEPPQRNVARTETRPPMLVGVGRLTPQKGFDVLIQAIAMLPTAEVVILGEGAERERLERMRDQLGLHDRVRLPGSSDDVPAVLRSVDALVLPSRAEAFPLVVLEAMHAGLPVVASDVGSVSEAVIAGRTGLVVPPDDVSALADAIERVLVPRIGPKMGAEGRALARERFTRRRMASDYERVYRTLMG